MQNTNEYAPSQSNNAQQASEQNANGYNPNQCYNAQAQNQRSNGYAPTQQSNAQQPQKKNYNNRPANNNQQNRNVGAADFSVVNSIVESAKEGFEQIAKSVGLDLRFYEEAIYAQQLIEANYNNSNNKKYTLASAHPDSIRNALILVANSGLTLNPMLKLAYLVPRWNSNAGRLECHLEPSYKGLIRVARDSGAIDVAVTELVYEHDEFSWVDRFSKPIHNFDPFAGSRGELKGGYCMARRPDGSYICTPVNMTLINKVKALSKGGVWNSWMEQMVSKSIIRQAFKDWPIFSSGPMASRLAAMQGYLRKVDESADNMGDIYNEGQPAPSPQEQHYIEHL